MRKKCLVLCLTGVMAVIVSACGGEFAGTTEGDAVSGSAVSGNAVSGQPVSGSAVSDPVVSGPAVKEEDAPEYSTNEEYLFCTDTNLYRESDFEKENAIIQSRLDGSHEKKIKMENDFTQFICIRDGYLYYFTDQDVDEKQGGLTVSYISGSTIWRVPVKKDKSGYDRIEMEQKEKVLEDEEIDLSQIYINDRYIFYKVNLDPSFVKYDRKKKKKLPVDELPLDGSCEEIVGLGDTVILFADQGAYIHKLSGTGWKRVSSAGISWESMRAYGETSFFFSGETDYPILNHCDLWSSPDYVSRCDVITGESKEIVSRDQLRQAVAKAEGLTDDGALDVCLLTDLFCQGDRCYMQVQANWMDGETYRMEYLMFSCTGEKDQGGIRYEKELTECLRVYGKAQEGKWVDSDGGIYSRSSEYKVLKEYVTAADSRCYGMVGGKAFFYLFDYEKKKAGVGCFDLDTRKFRWLTKKDKEFYEPCYGTWGAEDIELNYKMPPVSLMACSADMRWGISEDPDMDRGHFVHVVRH